MYNTIRTNDTHAGPSCKKECTVAQILKVNDQPAHAVGSIKVRKDATGGFKLRKSTYFIIAHPQSSPAVRSDRQSEARSPESRVGISDE